MKRILVVVDMQNDFITGSIGSHQAQAIVPRVVEKINEAHAAGDIVFTTRDQHSAGYLDTQEGKKLPVEHCMVGEWGFELEPRVKDVILPDDDYGIEKPTFGSFDLVNTMLAIEESTGHIDEIEVCGLCTDICVIANVVLLKTAFPEARIVVDPEACAGVTMESHYRALKAMQTLQVDILWPAEDEIANG